MISWWAIRRLHRIGVTLPSDSVQAACQALRKKMSIVRNVRVLQSSIISSPVVVGIFQSVIFLPVSLSTSLPIAQIEAILAHELAHVKRFDFAVNLAQTIVETLFFYHPAIWWISKQIRVERENCCDDSVVSLLGNRCEYGRALLAIEERMGVLSTLALGAKDGSLLARIQRLSNRLDQRRSTPYGNMTATLLFAGLMVASTLGLVSVLLAQGDRKLIPFGAESNGLRFRLIPLSPDIDDDSPDLQRVVHTFRRSSDVTFAVELKNVGSKPIVLAGIRYGEGYAEESRGKRNASMFAPHWFEFEIMDKEGKPITRPQRSYHESWSLVSGASYHVLQPGEAMVEVLRPSKFHAPMSWDFLPGEYQVRCRYHGPSDAMKEQIAKHWPSKEITKAWTHEVSSNLLELSVGDQDRPLDPSQLVWGEPVEGLQAAVEFRSPEEVKEKAHVAPGVPARTPIQVLFHVRNVSDRPISFVSETSRQGDSVKVLDESGKPVAIETFSIPAGPSTLHGNFNQARLRHSRSCLLVLVRSSSRASTRSRTPFDSIVDSKRMKRERSSFLALAITTKSWKPEKRLFFWLQCPMKHRFCPRRKNQASKGSLATPIHPPAPIDCVITGSFSTFVA